MSNMAVGEDYEDCHLSLPRSLAMALELMTRFPTGTGAAVTAWLLLEVVEAFFLLSLLPRKTSFEHIFSIFQFLTFCF